MIALPRYSLRILLVIVAVTAVILGIALSLDLISRSLFLLAIAVYSIGKLLPSRARYAALAVSLTMAILPWTGAGVGVLRIPGTDSNLPTLDALGKNNIIIGFVRICKRVYSIAEFPLQILPSEYGDFVYFLNSGTVRPFVVFAFWGLISLAMILAMVTSRIQRNKPVPVPDMPATIK